MRTRNLLAMIVGASLAAAMLTGAASAATPSEAPSVSVKYADLDLSTDQGLHVLYRRIVAAAGEVCPQWLSNNIHSADQARACRKAAIARAVEQLNNPQLAEMAAKQPDHG